MDATSGVAGVLWWLAVAGLFFGVIPLLLFIAHRLFGVVREIKEYVQDMQPYATAIAENVAPISELQETRELTGRVRGHLSRYAEKLDRML